MVPNQWSLTHGGRPSCRSSSPAQVGKKGVWRRTKAESCPYAYDKIHSLIITHSHHCMLSGSWWLKMHTDTNTYFKRTQIGLTSLSYTLKNEIFFICIYGCLKNLWHPCNISMHKSSFIIVHFFKLLKYSSHFWKKVFLGGNPKWFFFLHIWFYTYRNM